MTQTLPVIVTPVAGGDNQVGVGLHEPITLALQRMDRPSGCGTASRELALDEAGDHPSPPLRLDRGNDLTEDDLGELLAMIKAGAGFSLDTPPPATIPFTKLHFGGVKHQPLVLKGIANVQGVNRLVPEAQLKFCPAGLTVVYGRNGSGKSGFVRILRTACRTRIEKAGQLKVLADVYGDGLGPQSANIIIDTGTGDTPVKWEPGMTAPPELM